MGSDLQPPREQMVMKLGLLKSVLFLDGYDHLPYSSQFTHSIRTFILSGLPNQHVSQYLGISIN
jgi:hypothetical protein